MTDNVAVLDGYTKEILGDAGQGTSLHLLVKPDADLDDTFRAYCTDTQGFIRVNGWLFTFETLR